MALKGASPRDVFGPFQNHLNRILNKTLTPWRLTLSSPGGDSALLAFFRGNRPVAVPIGRGWYLFLGQRIRATRVNRRDCELLTVQYEYRLQRAPGLDEEAVIRFEYKSRDLDPAARYCRNHVQLHRKYHGIIPHFSPKDFHVPTGWVAIEELIRFAITDLRIKPRSENWDSLLNESIVRSHQWTGRNTPE